MGNQMSEKQDQISALKQLAFNIKDEVNDGLSKGLIQPDIEQYFRWKIDKFQYTKDGVTEKSAHGENFSKKSWFRAYIEIGEIIKKSDEYSSALELLTKISERSTIAHDLERFTTKLIFGYLDDLKFSDADVDFCISIFLKDINEELLKYGAEVELDGIVILPERIEFKIGDTNIILRQTIIEDLEKEYPIYGFTMQPHLKRHSAILNIEFSGKQSNEIQLKVEQAITILRLFKVGSVKYISYHMHSESITDFMASGTLTAGETDVALEKSHITQENTQTLEMFWQVMTETLPYNFYEHGETKLDHTTISYKRYCDALLQNGVIEGRIANAVMGLEGLFLKGSENQELIYRLSIRIAKIFHLLGFDSYKVKEIVRDAYKVRSIFVHGDHLSDKDKRKLINNYGDIRSFLLSLLDYLRISIIIMICMKEEKEKFIDLIDVSLVDKDIDSQLNILLDSGRNIIT